MIRVRSDRPNRGEIWNVRFDPSEGDEILKIRPAIVMTAHGAGRMRLQIVVPVTGWQPQFENYFWLIRLSPSETNGLTKESAADAFQVKSVSEKRFERRLGRVDSELLDELVAAIMLCIGFEF